MHNPHEPIAYSRNNMFKTYESPHQCYFKGGDTETNNNEEYPNFLHKYCDADHSRNLSGRRSVTSIVHLFNITLIYWCAKKNMKPQEAVPIQKQEQFMQEQ